jgi:hypothetical protein
VALFAGLAGVRATTVAPPSFSQLVNGSDYIVRARVKSVKSEWKEKEGQRHIFTAVELEVLEVIRGTPPQPLVLEMLGGKVGEDELVVQGMPRFAVGQEDILFVRGNGRQFFPLTAAMHGRYPIHRDARGNASVARSNDEPLHDAAEVALPITGHATPSAAARSPGAPPALTPEQFVRQIRSADVTNHLQHER